jgi:hypothetical protein
MSKIGDIVGGKVVFNSDTLLIPSFKKIWDSCEDKSYAHNVLAYIVFKHRYDSPYVISLPEEARDRVLKAELFKEGWEPDADVLEAERMYLEFTNTLTLRLLRSYRKKLEEISAYLEMPSSGMDMKEVKETLAAGALLDKVISSIAELEKKIVQEEAGSSSARGGVKVGLYEIPKKKR